MAHLYPLIFFFMFSSCSTMVTKGEFITKNPIETSNKEEESKKEKKKDFLPKVLIEIPLEKTSLKAEVLRPKHKTLPKTTIVIVPSSGQDYKELSEELSSSGFFVLSYERRSDEEVDNLGINALSKDLDKVCDFVLEKGQNRLVLLGSGQGAQVISESPCLLKANSIVLISPILEDLEKTWTYGLDKLRQQEANDIQKNKYFNKAESTRHFFDSLRKGKLPQNSVFQGASVKFWQTWYDSSKNTLKKLNLSSKSILLFIEKDDPYYNENINNKLGKNFILKIGLNEEKSMFIKDFLSRLSM